MYCYKYPHPAVTVDCIVFREEKGKLYILLIRRGNEPFKDHWAFPGGFLNPDETAEEAVTRELKEETGLVLENVSQLKAYTDPDRDPRERVITIAFTAFTETADVKGDDDAAEARWFSLDNLPPLAFDHSQILQDAMNRIHNSKCMIEIN